MGSSISSQQAEEFTTLASLLDPYLLIQTRGLTPVATPGPAYRDGGLPRRVPMFQQGLGKLSLGHNLQKETKGKHYVCNSRPILKHSPLQNASLTAPPELIHVRVSIYESSFVSEPLWIQISPPFPSSMCAVRKGVRNLVWEMVLLLMRCLYQN